MPIDLKTMREVVEELRRGQGEARLELVELEQALSDVLAHVTTLDGVLRELHGGVAALAGVERDRTNLKLIRALEGRAGRASGTAELLLSACAQIHFAVREWGAGDAGEG
jgi:hypothetical protein